MSLGRRQSQRLYSLEYVIVFANRSTKLLFKCSKLGSSPHTTYVTGQIMILEWVHIHETAFWWIGILSMATFVGTIIIIPILIVRIPADYFKRKKQKSEPCYKNHYAPICFIGLVFKNLLGIIFVLAGLAMLFLPGQGFITILIGIMMLNFPGNLHCNSASFSNQLYYRLSTGYGLRQTDQH